MRTFARGSERRKRIQGIDQLCRPTPKEFEEYLSDLYQELGYQRANLRGRSGDEGTDILVEKDGDRLVIQCKRYKGIVSPSAVRELLGTLRDSEAQRVFLLQPEVLASARKRQPKIILSSLLTAIPCF